MAGPISAGRFEITGAVGSAFGNLYDIRLGIRNGYVFELRDIRQSEALRVHVLVLNPRAYHLSEPFQSNLTPGEDNSVVTEENGFIIREITIEGTTGLEQKRASGWMGAQGGGNAMDGNAHFMHLRTMFRTYSRMKKDPKTAPFVRLLFHSIRDDDHFIVVPRAFETPRDARQARLHYEYRITMAAVAEVDGSTLRPSSGPSSFLDDVTDVVSAIAEGFNDARAAFAEVTATISEVRRKVANIQAVMINAAAFLNAVGNFLKASADLINYPIQAANAACTLAENAYSTLEEAILYERGTLDSTARSLRRMFQAMDRITSHPEKFGPNYLTRTMELYSGEKQLTREDIQNRTGGATLGTRTRLGLGSGSRAGLNLSGYNGIERVQISRTTTIEGLANRYSVPAELIILINDLSAPYITEGGGPGMLGVGDYILIPVADSTKPASNAVAEYLTPEEALYGIDLALDPEELKNGQLEIREDDTHDLMDAQLVRGLQNVVQGMEIITRTELGSTSYIPDLGIRRSAGVRGTPQHVLMASLNLREAILSDPRVDSIQDFRIVLDGDVLTQEISPQLKGTKDGVTFVLPFGKASEG